MPELPCVTANEAIKAFAEFGFVEVRITASHHILKKAGFRYNLSIPKHGQKNLKPGLLKSQIKTAGITVGQFVEALRS